jgi:hypothetical protein
MSSGPANSQTNPDDVSETTPSAQAPKPHPFCDERPQLAPTDSPRSLAAATRRLVPNEADDPDQ